MGPTMVDPTASGSFLDGSRWVLVVLMGLNGLGGSGLLDGSRGCCGWLCRGLRLVEAVG